MSSGRKRSYARSCGVSGRRPRAGLDCHVLMCHNIFMNPIDAIQFAILIESLGFHLAEVAL
jgi:hypothetical protein